MSGPTCEDCHGCGWRPEESKKAGGDFYFYDYREAYCSCPGIGFNESGGAQRIVGFLSGLAKKGIDIRGLIARIQNPIRFVPPHGGNLAHGASNAHTVTREAEPTQQRARVAVDHGGVSSK